MAKQRSLRQVRSFDEVCDLTRDCLTWGDWSIMTDGVRVWISRQKIGEKPTHNIEIPKPIYDRLHDAYSRPLKIVR